ncbi:hypothetical protein BESB_075570 [Besnoitia besnoiti]|uniref:Uncharacterized protein n=1 Tax=Besnoitia besnoiti TaxID=94643 RepID=A0A2A9M8V4_BESBE|nr:uncharacterized protein BESB_075570 [Besnoitia besnoiti]PFH34405.1 hypothetical protein BESB_075570 [Besnoitia besnoiti]
MSSLRERQADQSHLLLGRSRAERLLDGIYQRQKKHLLQQRRRAAAEAAWRIVLPDEKRRRLALPERATPDRESTQQAVTKPSGQAASQKGPLASEPKSVEDAVATLQRHMWKRAKFGKTVKLLQQLWQSHFSPATKRCLFAGLLTAASTDTCVSAAEGRAEIQAFFRDAVEPLLQKDKQKKEDLECLLEGVRTERRRAREAVLRAQLEAALHGRKTETESERTRGGRGGHRDAGREATVAAVAEAAAALAVDHEDRKRTLLTSQDTGSAAAGGLGEEPGEAEGADADGETLEVTLSDAERELLEILQLRCKTHLLLFTDDPFQFNQQIAELRRAVDAIVEGVQAAIEAGEVEEDAAAEDEGDATPDDKENHATSDTGASDIPDGSLLAEAPRAAVSDISPSRPRETSCPSGAQPKPDPEKHSTATENASAEAVSVSPRNRQEETQKEGTPAQPELAPPAAPEEGDGGESHGSSTSGSKTKGEKEDSDDGEAGEEMLQESPEVKWPLPLRKYELLNLMRCFFMDCLATIFSYRGLSWARASIEQLFQHVYLHRSSFSESDQDQISLWQAQLKVPHKTATKITALGIGEAAHPVQDGRDERISTVHGSVVWSAKQMGC